MHEKLIKRYSLVYGLIAGLVAMGLFFVLAQIAGAFPDIWYRPDKATMSWNPVTAKKDGTTIPDTSLVVYHAYLQYSGQQFKQTTDPITATQFTFTFPDGYEGAVYGCAQALRVDKAKWNADPPEIVIQHESEIVCSDDPANVAATIGDAWGWSLWIPPANPGGLEPQ